MRRGLGRLSGTAEESAHCDGAAVVQGAIQDTSPVCAGEAARTSVHCIGAAAEPARAAQGAACASWRHAGNRSRHMVAKLPQIDDES